MHKLTTVLRQSDGGKLAGSNNKSLVNMRRRVFDCSVIGDVMLDVFVGGLGTNTPFLRNGTSYCNFAKIEFGGAGNMATSLSSFGAKVSFIGKAGNDRWGRLYKEDLTDRGITAAISFEKRIPTGLSLVSVTPIGERSFYVFRGANDRLSTKDIDKSVNLLKNSEYVYFSGYSLVADPQRSAILHAVRLAKKHGVKLFFDPGAYNLIETNFELFNRLLDDCDVFCPNIDEAKSITKSTKTEEAILKLQKTCKLVGLKCGSKGCILVDHNKRTRVPASKVNAVDTTGAGDAFAAALLYGLTNKLDLHSIGSLANWFAAQVVTEVGARRFPSKSQVAKFQKTLRRDARAQ